MVLLRYVYEGGHEHATARWVPHCKQFRLHFCAVKPAAEVAAQTFRWAKQITRGELQRLKRKQRALQSCQSCKQKKIDGETACLQYTTLYTRLVVARSAVVNNSLVIS